MDLSAQAGPDTGLPAIVEVVVAVLFYAGPLLLAALALRAWRHDRRGWAVIALGCLGASIYTEAAFLDLACSPGGAGCGWVEARLPVAAGAALLALAGASALALGRTAIAVAAASTATALGLYVTLGYLVELVR